MLITGASRGIGRATALLFTAEAAQNVINDIDGTRLDELRITLTASGADVRSAVGDVAKTEDARSMVAACVEAFGHVDALFANAGIIPERDLLTVTAEDFDHVLALEDAACF